MDDEEILTSDSISPLTNAANTNYKPTAVHQPRWDPFQQNVPKTPSGPVADRLSHGVQREWGQEDPHKPLVFPLSGQATPQLSPVQAQPTFLGVASASADGSSYDSPTVYDAPSSSQAAESPGIESWQPDNGGYGVVDVNTDSSSAGNNNHLVYEEVFRYPNGAEPSQSYDGISNAAGGYGQAGQGRQEASTRDVSAFKKHLFPWLPSNAGAQLIYPARMEDFLGRLNFNFRHAGYQPRDDGTSLQPQKAAKTEKVEVSQRMSEPVFPPAPPSYIIQSRNGYQRGWHRLANSKYTPEFNAAVPMSSNGAKGSATSPPAAPKGVKNPQRYSCQKIIHFC